MSKLPTIYDIARDSGVSPSTVAAVLNGSWRKRRIKEETARAIQAVAERHGYQTNLQARGLRKAQSGMIAMIVPLLDNRFFSSLAQAFEAAARHNKIYPVVISTMRDAAYEQATARALIAHNIEALFIAGATDPDAVSRICRTAGIAHVILDLPGTQATSVISDNVKGAEMLTHAIIRRMKAPNPHADLKDLYFIGGPPDDHNTRCRLEGYGNVLKTFDVDPVEERTMLCGYDSAYSERAIHQIYETLGRLPAGIFVNSTLVFEGVARFLKALPVNEVLVSSIGCFDWDPYLELLHFPLAMIRQDVDEMIACAFHAVDDKSDNPPSIILIQPHLVDED